jgi:naphthalene 1,2-dioxygenase system ferredoxin subunit
MSQNWKDLMAQDDVFPNEVIGVLFEGHDLAIYDVEGEVFATDNICNHGHARLCEGFLEGFEIECPHHQGRFDVRDGKALCAPLTESQVTYPVKIENGRVFIDLG